MKEISLGIGFLKLQAVQHGVERLRREPDVRDVTGGFVPGGG